MLAVDVAAIRFVSRRRGLLPWFGPLVPLPRVPRSWAAGLTELPGGGKLLVSRGIGVERGYAPPLRFLCRPELVVIELVPGE